MVKGYKEKEGPKQDVIQLQPHYDNTHGSLYKISQQRGWDAYQFDLIKRIDRCKKKGNFIEDLDKTKGLIDLYIQEEGSIISTAEKKEVSYFRFNDNQKISDFMKMFGTVIEKEDGTTEYEMSDIKIIEDSDGEFLLKNQIKTDK